MTRLNWQGVAALALIVLLAVIEAAAYNAVMGGRHGIAGTISSGMHAAGQLSPLFAALVGALLVGGAVGLVVHWFDG